MKRSGAARLPVALAAALAACVPGSGATAQTSATPSPIRQHQLLKLLTRDCGSCHGMRLAGGLGPALTPEALRDKAVRDLETAILQGRAGTLMPPWGPFLSADEARWLVDRMRSGAIDAR